MEVQIISYAVTKISITIAKSIKSPIPTVLCKNGEAVEDVTSPDDGLQRFLDFIKEQAEGNEGGRADLVAHNGVKFDGHCLHKNFMKFKVDWGTSIR